MKHRIPDYLIKTKSDEQAIKEGCYYDGKEPENFRNWVESNFILSNGVFAGKSPELLQWHYQDVIQPLLGWKTKEGHCRYREVGIWIPRKNAKSWLCSALCLWFAETIKGASVFCLASDIEQAKIVYDESCNMLELGALAPLCGRDGDYWIRRNLKTIEVCKHLPHSIIKVLSSSPVSQVLLTIYAVLTNWRSMVALPNKFGINSITVVHLGGA